MSTKEQVKHGKLTPQEAMAKVSKDSHTYGWGKRRLSRGITAPVVAVEAPVEDEKPKNKYKKKNYQKPKKS